MVANLGGLIMGMVVKMSPMITMMPTSQVRLLGKKKITGVSREKVIQIAREFAENAHKTQGNIHGHHRSRHEPLVSS